MENTLQNNKNHTKQCGKGSDVEQMRSMDEMARIKVEKGYMTTPMAWIRADKKSRKGKGRKALKAK